MRRRLGLFSKALTPIFITVVGMMTEVNLGQSEKIPWLMNIIPSLRISGPAEVMPVRLNA